MLKRGIFTGLLCITSYSYAADVVVTTTEDVSRDDKECSLREAIEFINLGKPEAGYQGCGGKDASSVIILEGKKKYQLNKQIRVSQTLSIRSKYDPDINQNLLGKSNAIIKMQGQDRIFWVERAAKKTDKEEGTKPEKPSPILLTLFEVSLDGCGKSQCADQGGLIYNKDNVSLSMVKLLNGYARQGGAIYNAGYYEKDQPLSSVIVNASQIEGNVAQQGAVVYSQVPQYIVLGSLLQNNKATGAQAALLEVEKGFTEEELKDVSRSTGRGMTSSTIYNNTGYVAHVHDLMVINNSTILFNTKGLRIQAPFDEGVVANSILVNNGNADCEVLQGGKAKQLSNNLYGAGCAGELGQEFRNMTLIAGKENAGDCDLSSDGILCPLKEYKDATLSYFKPRLLASYQSLADSPIVNRGPTAGSGLMSCSADGDQRGKMRLSMPELCDRGAIELTVNTSDIAVIGQDIFYGETAKFSVADQLLDGELIQPQQCEALVGKHPNGQAWQAGCMKIVQTGTVSKGSTKIAQNGDIQYQPNGNWHGLDEFKLQLITTTTRFNDSRNPYIEVPVRVVQSPPDSFENKKVSTSGGATAWGVLLGLIGLLALRRRTQ